MELLFWTNRPKHAHRFIAVNVIALPQNNFFADHFASNKQKVKSLAILAPVAHGIALGVVIGKTHNKKN